MDAPGQISLRESMTAIAALIPWTIPAIAVLAVAALVRMERI